MSASTNVYSVQSISAEAFRFETFYCLTITLITEDGSTFDFSAMSKEPLQIEMLAAKDVRKIKLAEAA